MADAALIRSDDCDDTYDWIKVELDCGDARATYRVTGGHVDGREDFDEDMEAWSDADIRKHVGLYLGVLEADRHLIQIDR